MESQGCCGAPRCAPRWSRDRDRIACDLHDTVIQRLFRRWPQPQAAASMTETEFCGRTEAVVGDLGEMIFDLRTTIFSPRAPDVGGGLRGELLTPPPRRSGVRAGRPGSSTGRSSRRRPRRSRTCCRCCAAGVANVAKHAQATRPASVVVDADGVIVAADDGIGAPGRGVRGSGLSNLAARAEELGDVVAGAPAPMGDRSEWRVPRTRSGRSR